MIDEGHAETERLIADMTRKVKLEYQEAFTTIEDRLNEFLAEFAVEEKEMKQKLKDGKITQKKYKKWREEQLMTRRHWEAMRDTIAADIHNANEIARSIVQGYLPEAYAINMNYGTYLVEHGLRVETNFTLYDRSTVEYLLRTDPKLIPNYNSKLSELKDIAYQKRRMQSIITQAVLTGESIPRIAKHIADDLKISNEASTIKYARTAMTGAQNAGRQDSYTRAERMGIELDRAWVAALDNRTRHEHRLLDGQTVGINEPFTVNGDEIMFPGDPDAPGYLVWNCRCTTIPQLKGFARDLTDLSIRNTRKLGDMTYNEWKEALKQKDGDNGSGG